VATQVIMPALGMAQDTGTVLGWLKQEGDVVAKGEALLEVETDKVTVEVESPADGRLAAVRAAVGEEVAVGVGVAVVLAEGEAVPDSEPQEASVTPPAPVARLERAAADVAKSGGAGHRPLASPKARRLASAHGLALASVTGTGPHGAIVAADLEAALPSAATPSLGGRLWERMAERVTTSWQTAPHFFLMREVDATRLESRRAACRDRTGLEGVTHTDLLLELCAAALREHPRVNAVWRDGLLAQETDVNIGVAVAVDDGLVVPVVHGVDRLGLGAIAARRAELVTAAREGRLRPEDVAGGTFTISNLGMYGVDGFYAIVNPPQVAILAVGRIADRVVAVDGVPAVRPTLVLGLSFDHRAVDGAHGAAYLDALARLIEEYE